MLFVGQAVGCTVHGDAGIDYGQTLQLGEGGPAAAKDGTPGNLFVQVSVLLQILCSPGMAPTFMSLWM